MKILVRFCLFLVCVCLLYYISQAFGCTTRHTKYDPVRAEIVSLRIASSEVLSTLPVEHSEANKSNPQQFIQRVLSNSATQRIYSVIRTNELYLINPEQSYWEFCSLAWNSTNAQGRVVSSSLSNTVALCSPVMIVFAKSRITNYLGVTFSYETVAMNSLPDWATTQLRHSNSNSQVLVYNGSYVPKKQLP